MNERLFRVVLWFCAGIGIDIGDRLFDHFLDQAVDGVPWLAWLQ